MAEPPAPGWDAIDAALLRHYPGQEPAHFGGAVLPGQGVEGVRIYRAADHWHYVTYGLSELYEKEAGGDPLVSGWGFELTFRVAAAGQSEPPPWALRLVKQLGDAVYRTGNPYAPGHRLDPGGPITGGTPPTALTAVAFVEDPELGRLETPNGSLVFLQVVGISRPELAEMKSSSTAAVVERLRQGNPLLVTMRDRQSVA